MSTPQLAIRITADSTQAVAAVDRFGSAIGSATSGSDRLAVALGRIGHYGLAGGGIAALAATVKQAAGQVFEASAAAQRLATQLNFATDGRARQEMAFVGQVANRLGLQITSTAQAFAGFSAAARGTSLEGASARRVFDAMAQASAVMGLSADQTSGALLAVQQMMSKGVVSAEEFRGQLGERMPIALQAGAQALGVTTAEFSKLLETGQIVAADFLPKFADAIKSMIGGAAEEAANRLDASTARMGNAWTRLKQTVGDSGVSQALAGLARAATSDMDAISRAMDRAKASGGGFFMQANAGLGQFIGRAVGLQYVNRDFLTLDQAIADATATIRRFDEQEQRYGGLSIYAMSRRAEAVRDLAQANRELAASGREQAGGGAGRGSINPETVGDALSAMRRNEDAKAALLNKLSGVPDGYVKDMQEVIRLHQAGALVGKEYSDVLAKMQAQLLKKTAPEKSEAQKRIDEGVKLAKALVAEDAGLSGDFVEKWNHLSAAYAANAIGADQLAIAQRELLSHQPAIKHAADAELDARNALLKQQGVAIEYDLKQADSLAEQITRQREHNAAIGKTAEQLAALEDAKLADAEATAAQRLQDALKNTTDAATIDAITLQVEGLRELRKLKSEGAIAQASADAAKAAAEEWKRTSEQIGQSLADALMQGGKSARDYIKGLFRTTLIKVPLQAVITSITGSIGTVLGLTSTAAGAAGSGNSTLSALNGASTANSLYNLGASGYAALSTWMAGTTGAGLSTATTAGTGYYLGTGASTYGTVSAGTTYGTIGAGSAAGTTAAATSSSSMMASLATAAPYVAAALIAANALGLFKGTEQRGSYLTGTLGSGSIRNTALMRDDGSLFSGPDYWTQDRGLAAQSDAIQKAFDALRTSTATLGAQMGASSDSVLAFTKVLGSDGIAGRPGGLRLDGLTAEQAQAKVTAALQSAGEDLASLALRAAAVAEGSKGLLQIWSAIGAVTKEGETSSQTLARLTTALSTANRMLDTLGGTLYAASLSGAGAAQKLADAFGGLDAMVSTSSAYYQAYYSDQERNAISRRQLGDAFAGAGLGAALPGSRSDYRALVESQNLLTDTGRAAYATLLKLAPVFDQLMTAADAESQAIRDNMLQTAQAAAEAMARVLQERTGLETKLLQLQGDTAALRARELAGLDASNRALQERIYALEDAESAAAAAQKLIDAWRGVADSIDAEVARIRGIAGDSVATWASAQTAFTLATAQARAGDMTAAGNLPELSRTLLAVAENHARTAAELDAMRTSVADSLAQTALIARGTSTDTSASPLARLPTTATATAATASTGTTDLVSELRAQRAATARLESELQRVTAELQGMRAETQATAVNTGKSTRQMQEVIDRGVAVHTDADSPLATVAV